MIPLDNRRESRPGLATGVRNTGPPRRAVQGDGYAPVLVGRAPFASDDISAVFYQIIHLQPRPLGQRVPDLPSAVETVLLRALSKSMADRFPSIRDFANALESAAAGGPNESLTTARVPFDAAAGTGTAPGVVWVERRRAGRERRGANPTAGFAPLSRAGGTGTALDNVVRRSLWRKARPLVAIAGFTAGLILAALVPPRSSEPAPTARSSTPAASAFAEVPAATATIVRGPAIPIPAAGAAPPAETEARPRPVSPPARRSGKPHPAKPRRFVDDSPDPFAPSAPPSKPKASKRTQTDAEFVDPFAP